MARFVYYKNPNFTYLSTSTNEYEKKNLTFSVLSTKCILLQISYFRFLLFIKNITEK